MEPAMVVSRTDLDSEPHQGQAPRHRRPLGADSPLLPPRPEPKRPDRPGRPPIEDRKALTGIPSVLKTGINWEDLPVEMGCGGVASDGCPQLGGSTACGGSGFRPAEPNA